MTPQEVLDYVSRYVGGDASKARYGIEYKEVEDPSLSVGERAKRASLNQSTKIRIPVETWKTPDGQVIYAGYRDPQNAEAYVPVQQETPKPAGSTDTASNSPADRALDAEHQREREWNRDNGGLYETHAERKTRETADAVRAAAANKPGEVTSIEDDPAHPGQKHSVTREVDASGKPGRVIKDDPYTPPKVAPTPLGTDTTKNEVSGVTTSVEHVLMPDGTQRDIPSTATVIAGPKPPTMIDGKPFDIKPDPATGRLVATAVDIVGATPSVTQPESLAGWKPDATKDAYGLAERRDQIYALTNPALKGNPNYLTPDQAKELLKSDYDLTNTMVTQQNNVATAAGNQRSQDITQNGQVITDQGNRRSAANSMFNQVLTTSSAMAKNVPKGSNISGPAFMQLLQLAQDYADRAGGAAGMERPANIPQAPAVQKFTHVELPDGTKITAPHPEAPAAGITPGPISDTAAPSAWQTVNGVEPTPVEPPTISPEAAMQSGLGTQAAGIDPHNPDSVHDMLSQIPGLDPEALQRAREDSWAMSA